MEPLITKHTAAERIGAYLHHTISLPQMVSWAEDTMMEGAFAPEDADALRSVIPRLGLADVRAFGLSWDECEQLLHQLGYSVRIELQPSN